VSIVLGADAGRESTASTTPLARGLVPLRPPGARVVCAAMVSATRAYRSGPVPSSLGDIVRNLAAPLAGALIIVGALWFGFVSLSIGIAYSPVGVTPREVGLNSGAVLAQAGAAFAAFGIIYFAVLVGTRIFIARATGTRATARIAVLGAPLAALVSSIFLLLYAVLAGIALQDGRVPWSPLPAPWHVEVAYVHWIALVRGTAGTARVRALPRSGRWHGAALRCAPPAHAAAAGQLAVG
jgi:hypothetical protein